MKHLLYITVFLFSMIGNAQSAKEIVAKHFELTGGINQWNSLNSIKINGLVAVGVSDVVPIVIEHKRPYFKRVSYIINGTEMLNEGYDGHQAYTYDESNGKFKKLAAYKPDAFETDLLNYDKKGFKLEYLGKETVNGSDTYHLKLTKNNIEDYYWVDTKSYQIIKEQNNIETIYYSDFQKFGDLSFATRLEIQPQGGKEYVVIFNDIIPNASILDARFKFN